MKQVAHRSPKSRSHRSNAAPAATRKGTLYPSKPSAALRAWLDDMVDQEDDRLLKPRAHCRLGRDLLAKGVSGCDLEYGRNYWISWQRILEHLCESGYDVRLREITRGEFKGAVVVKKERAAL